MAIAASPFSVLFVCTGNICRSPIAEQLFRVHLDSPSAVWSSAGIGALEGQAMPAEAVEMSLSLGGDPSTHAARQLRPAMVQDADLVIALAREHRAEVVRMVPRANRYTFTLREFARLVESVVADSEGFPIQPEGMLLSDRLRSLVPVVASRRGYVQQAQAVDDDVSDPYGHPWSEYELAGGQIADAARRILTAGGSSGLIVGPAPWSPMRGH
jgi:protein-tyrosine phosphatase